MDAYFGTMELPLILKQFEADYKTELLGERLLVHPAALCLFENIRKAVIVPVPFALFRLMRGRHISKPIEELVKEAEGLVKRE